MRVGETATGDKGERTTSQSAVHGTTRRAWNTPVLHRNLLNTIRFKTLAKKSTAPVEFFVSEIRETFF